MWKLWIQSPVPPKNIYFIRTLRTGKGQGTSYQTKQLEESMTHPYHVFKLVNYMQNRNSLPIWSEKVQLHIETVSHMLQLTFTECFISYFVQEVRGIKEEMIYHPALQERA